MGCGRVGSSLATALEAAGHSVAIIDQSKDAFRRLGADFKGRTVVGVGFDRDTLLEAGIDGADAFAAVSNGDNSNILAARVAREIPAADTTQSGAEAARANQTSLRLPLRSTRVTMPTRARPVL